MIISTTKELYSLVQQRVIIISHWDAHLTDSRSEVIVEVTGTGIGTGTVIDFTTIIGP